MAKAGVPDTKTLLRILQQNSEADATKHAEMLLRGTPRRLARMPGYKKGDTPLLLAARSNAFHLVRALLSVKPECAQDTNRRGQTVLHAAVDANAREVIVELKPECSSGVIDINQRDFDGAPPIVAARLAGRMVAESALASHPYCVREDSSYAASPAFTGEQWDLVLATLREPVSGDRSERRVVVSGIGSFDTGSMSGLTEPVKRAVHDEQRFPGAPPVTRIVCTGDCDLGVACRGLIQNLRQSTVLYAVLVFNDGAFGRLSAVQLSAYAHPVLDSRVPCLIALDVDSAERGAAARSMLQSWADARHPLSGPFFGFVIDRSIRAFPPIGSLNVLDVLASGFVYTWTRNPTCSTLEGSYMNAAGANVACVMTHPGAEIGDASARRGMSWDGAGLRVMRENSDGRTVTLSAGPLTLLAAGEYECRLAGVHVAQLLVTPQQLGLLQLEDGSQVRSPVCSTASIVWRVRAGQPLLGCAAVLIRLGNEQLLQRMPVRCGAETRQPTLLEQFMWHKDAPQFIRLVYTAAIAGAHISVDRGADEILEARDANNALLLRCENKGAQAEAALAHNVTSLVRRNALLERMQTVADATANASGWVATRLIVVDTSNRYRSTGQMMEPHQRLAAGAADERDGARVVPAPRGRTLSTAAEPDVLERNAVPTLWHMDIVCPTLRNITGDKLYAQMLWFGQDGGIVLSWPPRGNPGLLPPGETVNLLGAQKTPWFVGVSDDYASMPFSMDGPDFVWECLCIVVARHPFSLAYAEQAALKAMITARSASTPAAPVEERAQEIGYDEVQVRVIRMRVRAKRM